VKVFEFWSGASALIASEAPLRSSGYLRVKKAQDFRT
jgi:hypothetical protein